MDKQVVEAETIEQFLARGGKKQTLEYIEPKKNRQEVLVNMVGCIMDLSEGELYFSTLEKREKKPIKVDNSNLPHDLLEKLRKRGIKIDG